MRTYLIELEPDDNGTFLVTCPKLPEVTTFGETPEEAQRNAVDAIEEALAARIARRAVIPEPDANGDVMLHVLPDLKIGLYEAMRLRGISRADLARMLDWNRNSVDRLFLLDHSSRIEQLEAAADALGFSIRADFVARQDERRRA